MFGSDEKVLVINVNTECYNECDYNGGCECNVDIQTHQINSINELATRFANGIGSDINAVKILLANPAFAKTLDQLGYRDISKIEDVDKKIIAERRYYLYDSKRYIANLSEIDLENLSDSNASQLATDKTMILQSVSKDSLKKINPQLYKKIVNRQNTLVAAAKARVANAEANKAKRLAKKLEKTKAALAEQEALLRKMS